MDTPELFSSSELKADGALGAETIRMKIIGIGGAGTNAVDRMKLDDLEQIHIAVADTDGQVLAVSPVEEKVLLVNANGAGKSAGGSPASGRKAAEISEAALRNAVEGMDIVFLIAGMGGGTGSGAAPLIAEMAADDGALVIAFVTLPFAREGKLRARMADEALAALRLRAHAVICLPNDTVFKHIDPNSSFMEAFAHADKWIKLGIQSIWSMVFSTGMVNVDFSTLQTALANRGNRTLFATGYGSGEDFVANALKDLADCPLLSSPEHGSSFETDQLIVHLSGGPDLSFAMVDTVMEAVSKRFACDNSMVMGASIDGNFYGKLRITVIGSTRPRTNLRKGYDPVPSASISSNAPKPERLKPAPEEILPAAKSAEATVEAARRAQEEFAFAEESDDRGLFAKVSANLYEGVDLDIPTYLRRGIRLPRG